MGLDAGEVYVVVGAKLDSSSIARANAAQRSLLTSSNEYQKSIDRAEHASNKLHAANERWAKAAVFGGKAAAIGIGTAAAALTGAAIAAASFDESMRNVNSIAGLSEKGFKKLESQVLRLSTAVGKSPKDLAEGLYSIVSSGFKAADAMKILTAGARAARAGLTDTATATGAITSVLNAYNLGAGQARKVSDLLFQTVNVGVLNFEQLAGSLGKVLPSAKGLGVSLRDLLGAEAALTLQGNSADEATTQLGQVMSALTKPSKGLAKELKSLGFESGQAAIAHLGFKGTLDELGKAAHGNQALLADWFGNIRAFRGVNGLEGTAHAAQLFTTSIKAMDEATKGSGETAKVYAEQQKSTAAQFEHLKASVDVAAITIGTALLPMINQGIGALTKWLATAQKSGDLEKWAHDIAHGVSVIVELLQSLGPAASKAFHVVASTVQAAIPFVEKLYELFQEIAPAIEDVAHAAEGLATALGPGPLLGMAAAFLVLKRASLTAQASVGTFAKIMQAGNVAIAGSQAGGLTASGRITKIGTAAVEAESKTKIFARGLVSTIGSPNLIAAGAAGIVVSLLYIKSTMTDLKKETQDVVDAIAEIQGSRLNIAAAQIAKARTAAAVVAAEKSAGSASVGVEKARAASLAFHEPGGHPNVPDPAIETALKRQAAAYLNVRDAKNQDARASLNLAAAHGQEKDSADKLAKQLGGLATKAHESAGYSPTLASTTLPLNKQRALRSAADSTEGARALDKYVVSLRKAVAASTDLDAAGKGAGNRIVDVVKSLGAIPNDTQFKIIANDVAAGKSLKTIKRDLGILDKTKVTPTVDADTQPADSKVHTTKLLIDSVVNAKHDIPITAHAVGVSAALASINSTILHFAASPFVIPVKYGPIGPPPSGGTSKTNRRIKGYDKFGNPIYAESGHKTTKGQPELAIIGEGADSEYVIPTEPKYRAGGIALWMQAGHDLGIPGYKAGKSPKPGKTPGPIRHGLGYDPAALDAQMGAEKERLDKARQYRDTLSGRVKTDSDHLKALQKQLATAKRGAGSKNKKTAAAARERVATITGEITKTQAKIDGERQAHKHQVDSVIPADTKRYEQATRAARVGDEHAAKIELWQTRADSDANAMQLASDQWDAADRKKDPAGKAKAYKAWEAARKARVADLGHVRDLLKEVREVVGKTKYGAEIVGQLSSAIGDIVNAQDDTAAPGYEAPDDTPASTSIDDYLYPEERAALAQAALDEAKAATTDDTQDDVNAANAAYGVAQWIAGRLQQDGAPVDILTQAFQDVASAKSDLESAVQGNKPDGSTTGVTADQQAALDQANTRAANAEATSASDRAALATFGSSLDLILASGGGSTNIYVDSHALTADSPSVRRKVGESVVSALGQQPYIPTSTGRYGG